MYDVRKGCGARGRKPGVGKIFKSQAVQVVNFVSRKVASECLSLQFSEDLMCLIPKSSIIDEAPCLSMGYPPIIDDHLTKPIYGRMHQMAKSVGSDENRPQLNKLILLSICHS